MKLSYRKATIEDVPAMFDVRRNSILELAPKRHGYSTIRQLGIEADA
jgi:hypothetical protein